MGGPPLLDKMDIMESLAPLHMANPVRACKLLHHPRPTRDMNDCLQRRENMRLDEKKEVCQDIHTQQDRRQFVMFC